MPRFRPVDPRLAAVPFTLDGVRRVMADAIAPRHFFVAPDLALEWTHTDREETPWEVFRGRLLDPAHTRQRGVFASWSIFEKTPDGLAAEPVLSLKLADSSSVLYVVRGLECYVWEGYDSGGGVILSRERRKWVRELVATLRLDDFANLDDLRDEIIGGLYLGVVGTSRLPLTSVEAPLPAFSFGRLFYWFRDDATEKSWGALFHKLFPLPVAAKLLQTFLLAGRLEDMTDEEFVNLWGKSPSRRHEVLTVLDAMFNDVSLSPWTGLAEKAMGFLRRLQTTDLVTERQAHDFRAGLVRKICRHLTAYDLISFHHRGANYPDALLLDTVEPVGLEEHYSESRLRRRALRQAWLIRRQYRGHLVPDLPTSPGENNRVLPASHPRVPEEQILQSTARARRLFYDADHPLPHRVEMLRWSVADLEHAEELLELGTGLFLDRPLAPDRLPGEPDASPLIASLAFSRCIAVRRIRLLAEDENFKWLKELLDNASKTLLEAPPRGIPLEKVGGASRPGIISLTDGQMASPDFEFLRTTAAAIRSLRELFDFRPIEEWFSQIVSPLIVRDPTGPGLHVYDNHQRLRMEIAVDRTGRYLHRGGVEYPAAGLLVTRVWEEKSDGGLREQDRRDAPIRLNALP